MNKSITFAQLKRYLRESEEAAIPVDAAPAAEAPATPAAAEAPAAPATPAAAIDPAIVELVKQLATACGLQIAETTPVADTDAAPVAERRRRLAERRRRLAERRMARR